MAAVLATWRAAAGHLPATWRTCHVASPERAEASLGQPWRRGGPSRHSLQGREGRRGVSWGRRGHGGRSGSHAGVRASSDLPDELLEDSKFVPIREDDPRFGPPVTLLMGFTASEVVKVQEMLNSMGGDFMEVKICTQKMTDGSLISAVLTRQEDPLTEQAAYGLPRICFLSGLTGEEIMMVVNEFPQTGMPMPAFAAMVPKNANKPLSVLVDEIMDDHRRLTTAK